MKKIIQNRGIYCTYCGDVVVSTSRHDFRYCRCGKSFVDGGLDYLRCGGESIPRRVKIVLLTEKA